METFTALNRDFGVKKTADGGYQMRVWHFGPMDFKQLRALETGHIQSCVGFYHRLVEMDGEEVDKAKLRLRDEVTRLVWLTNMRDVFQKELASIFDEKSKGRQELNEEELDIKGLFVTAKGYTIHTTSEPRGSQVDNKLRGP